MTNEKKPMTLAQKLAKIGKEIGAVSKSGTNKEQKYNYIEYGVVASLTPTASSSFRRWTTTRRTRSLQSTATRATTMSSA